MMDKILKALKAMVLIIIILFGLIFLIGTFSALGVSDKMQQARDAVEAQKINK